MWKTTLVCGLAMLAINAGIVSDNPTEIAKSVLGATVSIKDDVGPGDSGTFQHVSRQAHHTSDASESHAFCKDQSRTREYLNLVEERLDKLVADGTLSTELAEEKRAEITISFPAEPGEQSRVCAVAERLMQELRS